MQKESEYASIITSVHTVYFSTWDTFYSERGALNNHVKQAETRTFRDKLGNTAVEIITFEQEKELSS